MGKFLLELPRSHGYYYYVHIWPVNGISASVMIGHAASGWIRWVEKCISGRRCTVKLAVDRFLHNHLREGLVFKFFQWLAGPRFFFFFTRTVHMLPVRKSMGRHQSSGAVITKHYTANNRPGLNSCVLLHGDINRETSAHMNCLCTHSFGWLPWLMWMYRTWWYTSEVGSHVQSYRMALTVGFFEL